jgi:hypothetical protein
MSNVECPSQAWDRYIEGEDAAAEIVEAIETKVLQEVCHESHPARSGLAYHIEYEVTQTIRSAVSDIIRVAYKNGYEQANKDRADAEAEYESEMELQRIGKKYVVIPYLGISECDSQYEPMSYEDALKEQKHLELMQPENVYKIEEVD